MFNLYLICSNSLKLDCECIIELGVYVDVFLHERWKEFLKELPGDFLDCLLVDALLQEAALQDIAPPTLHVGSNALAKADLITGLSELTMENVNNVEAIGRDQVDLGVA